MSISFGYLVASSFAEWASQNQKKLASMRVSDSLSALCARKFQLEVSEQTVLKWDTYSASFLEELLDFELDSLMMEGLANTREEVEQAKIHWKNRKWDVLVKYFGYYFAETFRRRFGMEHDAIETHGLVRMDREADYIMSVISDL